ncbi:hypothetical protein OH784_26430 [Ectobacillus funiculus]|uniref:hypothetical protein n=1 Tax=Ectobacillus funiculus TaxID=137993 RepID=UPI0039790B8A
MEQQKQVLDSPHQKGEVLPEIQNTELVSVFLFVAAWHCSGWTSRYLYGGVKK